MKKTRREFLVGSMAAAGGLATLGAAARGPAQASPAAEPGLRPGGSAALLRRDPDHPQAAIFDRLDEAWHHGAIRRLQARLQEEGIDAALLGDRWNLIYFTGLWHESTERPFLVLIPASGADPTWFHPASIGTSWTPGGSRTARPTSTSSTGREPSRTSARSRWGPRSICSAGSSRGSRSAATPARWSGWTSR
ncbi:MAG: hypothetical protein DMF50_07100 [Acidobacteria bacterium]|nr:MAG: hypothetical protein DMF50_07100 [Acidobacteriota bacterium]